MTRRDLWVAPQEDGGILVDPPLNRVEELLETNRRRFSRTRILINGRPLQELRSEFLDSTRGLAQAMTWLPGEKRPRIPSGPLIATGHQPELFHPGVWLKNFALNGLAQRHGLAPLHVGVDTDLIKSTAIECPTWDSDPSRVGLFRIAFDVGQHHEPYLNSRTQNKAAFLSLPESARTVFRSWPFVPLLDRFWDETRKSFNETRRLGKASGRADGYPGFPGCFNHARRTMERDWRCSNLELPVSFLRSNEFVIHCLSDLPRLHEVYNASVRAYRTRHGIRSRVHPVPDLATAGDFLEAPFWWIGLISNHRQRLFVRSREDRIEITADLSTEPLSIRKGDVEGLKELGRRGVGIYTRALTTTMLIRLCFTDLFLHGIGGAKYDEVTDDIIRRYFGIEPPEYMVVSGTLRLPFPTFPATAGERRRLQRQARDLRWNPELFLDHTNDLVEQKRRWLAREPLTRDERRARYRELLHLTEALRPMVADQAAAVEREIARCDRELAANEILTRRDYPFVLYPESKLRPFLTQLL